MAFQVDGNTVTVLQIDDERIEVVGGDGGEPRGLALCRSEDDVRALLRGDLDAIVATSEACHCQRQCQAQLRMCVRSHEALLSHFRPKRFSNAAGRRLFQNFGQLPR